jgi:hypothetical protein
MRIALVAAMTMASACTEPPIDGPIDGPPLDPAFIGVFDATWLQEEMCHAPEPLATNVETDVLIGERGDVHWRTADAEAVHFGWMDDDVLRVSAGEDFGVERFEYTISVADDDELIALIGWRFPEGTRACFVRLARRHEN